MARKAQENWIPWKVLALDEDRVKSKSRRNAFKTRDPDKPIKEAWAVSKLGDKREKDGTYISNGIVKCGNYTYSNTDNGKMYNIIDKQIGCSDIKGSGRTVVLDSAYVTILFFRDAATVWKIKVVGTIRKRLKHLPSRFSDMKSSSKR